jgi:hypothetical protein
VRDVVLARRDRRDVALDAASAVSSAVSGGSAPVCGSPGTAVMYNSAP